MKKSYKTALSGMLLALSAGLSAAESLIPLPLGVKPGFSNIPVMFAMYEINTGCALAICILKSFFVFLTRGTTAFITSISGGLAAFFTMLLLSKKTKASLVLTSVAGSLMHNVGQLSAACFILGSSAVIAYMPVLIISGCIAGTVTGLCLGLLMPVLTKIKQK